LGDEITQDEMGTAYGMYGEEYKCIQSFSDETQRDHFQDLYINGRIILKNTVKK
jgi:hypothetical protein